MRLGRLTVACLTVLLALAGGASAASKVWGDAQDGGFGKFAGYNVYANLHEVSGRWGVPQLKPGSPPGFAGTWIGAEAPGPDGLNPFIQVGINEERFPLPTGAGFKPQYENRYFAFWSTTQLRFHPHHLFGVKPGDRIAASLALRDGRWRVRIFDLTSGSRSVFTTRQETGARFNVAEVIQEDVTEGDTGRPFPYPSLGDLEFAHLRINWDPVVPGALDAVWMSVGHEILAPTPESDNAFEIKPARPPHGALHYHDMALLVDPAEDSCFTQLEQPARTRSVGQIERACGALQNALRRQIRVFAHTYWSPRVRALLPAVLRASRAQLQTVGVWLRKTRLGLKVPESALVATNDKLRRATGPFSSRLNPVFLPKIWS